MLNDALKAGAGTVAILFFLASLTIAQAVHVGLLRVPTADQVDTLLAMVD